MQLDSHPNEELMAAARRQASRTGFDRESSAWLFAYRKAYSDLAGVDRYFDPCRSYLTSLDVHIRAIAQQENCARWRYAKLKLHAIADFLQKWIRP